MGLMDADEVLVASIENPKGLSDDELLNVSKLAKEITYQGSHGREAATVEEMVEIVAKEAKDGDVVAVFSNGGFGGIHQKLLDALEA